MNIPTLPVDIVPRINVEDLRKGEKPVEIAKTEREVENNGLFKFIEASFTFTNPNRRVIAGELEFPLPEGATVCGYQLEIDGEMVPGSVVEKEKARVAFENEKREGVDPGIVEQVKGNIWRTRIYPLMPKVPRKAAVTYIVPVEAGEVRRVVEQFGEEYFVGERVEVAPTVKSAAEMLAEAGEAWIVWDASRSRQGKVAADRERLESLPEKGKWQLVVFSNRPEPPRPFATKAELLAAIDQLVYDGGTDIAAALKSIPDDGKTKFLFSDGVDTLSEGFSMGAAKGVVFASKDRKPKSISVEKVSKQELKGKIGFGKLLAVAWAANRVEELADDAEGHRDELIEIGRKYGVASSATSMIVLETVDQWLKYKIEPPKNLAIYKEWKRRRQAQDDEIDQLETAAEHQRRLLSYWKERVEWWKKPKPEVQRPQSGLFSQVDEDAEVADGMPEVEEMLPSLPVEEMRYAHRHGVPRALRMALGGGMMHTLFSQSIVSEESMQMEAYRDVADVADRTGAAPIDGIADFGGAEVAAGNVGSTIRIAAWNPKAKYLQAIAEAKDPYVRYLKECEANGNSPAFYLDCAGWFFKHGDAATGVKVISNLAEFKLEDPALWRVMGWRLREAGAYDEAVRAFRHVLGLRGEEGQSFRDLALVLMERGKAAKDAKDVEEAMQRFHEAAFHPHARRVTRWLAGNEMQVSIVALEELNGLITWCGNQQWEGEAPKVPEFDKAFRREMPVALRVVMSWDADETDIDLHVLEPSGEEAYYGNRRTQAGGFVSEDVRSGYGPEEYLRKDAERGTYKILSNYYSSHQQELTGPVTVTATVYTNWGTPNEAMKIMTLRLDHPHDKHMVGELTV